MPFKKTALLAAAAAFVFLTLNFFGYWPLWVSPSAPYSKAVPKLSQESLNKIPVYFPRQFILGKSPEVISAAEEKDGSLVSIDLEFRDAENTARALAEEYEDYAPKAYWSLEKAETSSGGFAIRMKREFQDATISIEPDPVGGIFVKIKYRVKTVSEVGS